MKRVLQSLAAGLCLALLVCTGVQAQSGVTVTGRVTDNAGNPLQGASVMLTGSQTGISSGTDGRFSLPVPALSGSLTVTFIGMEAVAVPLRPGVTTYTVRMTESALTTETVVVTGYFERAKDNFTGTAVTIKGEELKQVNPNNLLQSIQAFDPSFRLADNNLAGSNPNALPNVNVRGAASLPSGNSEVLRRDNVQSSVNLPTFILDGYEVSVQKIYDLDMNRVESITVLKDAAATAIYGSRAANGVLVITTVAPRQGELRLSANYELTPGFADLSSYDLLSAKEKLQYEVDAGVYDFNLNKGASQQALNEQYYTRYYNILSGIDTDWLAKPVRNSLGHKLSLFLEGGDATMRYGVSGQFQTAPGVMKGSSRDRLGVGVDLSYYLKSKVIFKNQLSVANVAAQNSPYGNFEGYVGMNPYFSPYDPQTGLLMQNLYNWTTQFANQNSYVTTPVLNPLWDAGTGGFDKSKYWEISDSFTAEWFIASGLKFRALANYLHRGETADTFVSPNANKFYTELDAKKRGSYTYGNTEYNSVDASGTLTWGKSIGLRHFLNTAAGVNMRTENTAAKKFEAIGFTNDRFTDIGFASGYAEGAKPTSTLDKSHLFGAFLSANYSFDDRYLLDLSGRLDGSSRFGANNNVASFWAAGIGWNVHKEKFMESVKAISRLRLTANMGVTGSDSSNPYQAQTLYTYGSNWYSSGIGATVSQYGNEDLKWERTTQSNLGIEVGLIQDRFFLSAQIYNKLTKDMLANIALPTSTGFGTYKTNMGDVRNRGFELGLKANVFKNDDWNVNLNANLVRNQNRVMKISNELKKLNDAVNNEQTQEANVGVPLLRYAEGYSFNTIWAVQSFGIDPENGKEIYLTRDGRKTYNWNVNDVVPLREPEAKIEGFFGGSAYYKGFMLSLTFHTSLGGYNYNQTLVDRVENANPLNNVDRRAREDRWTTPGVPALYKNIQNRNDTNLSSRFIQKENTLELKTVYLSYDFQPAVYKKMGMKSLRLAATANDLVRFSTIRAERGINYPFARSITFSLQTSF